MAESNGGNPSNGHNSSINLKQILNNATEREAYLRSLERQQDQAPGNPLTDWSTAEEALSIKNRTFVVTDEGQSNGRERR